MPAVRTLLRANLERDGFVVIPGTLKPHELLSLRSASVYLAQQAREGKWPHVRTLPKQFPPWKPEDYQHGIWGVQHLLHPDLPMQGGKHSKEDGYEAKSQGLYAASYFSDAIVQPVRQLLQCREDELVMELYNLLVRPDRNFELRWHRDDISPNATAEEELERLTKPAYHAQWNLPLYDDRSLIVIPGSHKRARTETERNADPWAKVLPDMKVVYLRAGDLVFYDNNILHRGVYDATLERMTLHGSIGHVAGSQGRARNVLQHGVGEWVERCQFDMLPDHLRRRAEGMKRRLFEMAGERGGTAGFSQPDA